MRSSTFFFAFSSFFHFLYADFMTGSSRTCRSRAFPRTARSRSRTSSRGCAACGGRPGMARSGEVECGEVRMRYKARDTCRPESRPGDVFAPATSWVHRISPAVMADPELRHYTRTQTRTYRTCMCARAVSPPCVLLAQQKE